jgi:mannosyl-3-phosphoglycerate phosphatase
LKHNSAKIVIFTDLDGTLLDEKYGYMSVKPLINQLLQSGVSIVFCSSKTEPEVEFYRKKLGVADPFIVENGGAIFVPKGYFPFAFQCSKQTEQYDVIELGVPYKLVREKLAKIKLETGAGIVGFGDMTAEELTKDSGLPPRLVRLAKKREFDEPFRLLWGNEKEVQEAIDKAGLCCVMGSRYLHLLGCSNKGKAAAVLKDMFVKAFSSKTVTFGVGDSAGDLSMLRVVDVPLLVRNASGGRNANLVVWSNVLRLVAEKREE